MRLKSGWETEVPIWIRPECERTQMPEIDQIATGLPGGNQRVKKGSQNMGFKRLLRNPK